MAASAFALGTLGASAISSDACGQNGSILPRFASTASQQQRTNSPSVNMKLAQYAGRATGSSPQAYRSPQTPRLAMAPQQYGMPVRHRRQDGDVFGEDQAGGGDPFGEPTVKSPITGSPFDNVEPDQRNVTPLKNPFGEPEVEPPVLDPTPRTPAMDTSPVAPRLPRGSEFTPDPNSIPDLPRPDGSTRESEKARTDRSVPDPDGIDLEDFNEGNFEEKDPQARRPRTTGRRERDADYDDPRRPFRSNVYRPAPEPSYYSKPTGPNPYLDPRTNPYAAANPNAINPYALNPYLMNPYAANPYAANAYAGNPYAANPYAMNPLGYNCPPACQGCASCPPVNACATCPTAAPVNSYAGCPTPTPATCNDGVYENVIGEEATLGINGRSLNNPLMPSGVPLYYVSLFGGWSDLSDLEIVNEAGTINLNSENGLGIGAAFGQIQGRNLRTELEVSYRSQDIENLLLRDLGTGRETLNGVGDIKSYAGMLNVYWEFVDLFDGPFSPYVGAGVGAVNVSADMRLNGGQDAFRDGEDSSFAYQYIAGVNYKLQSYSDLFIEYRHFAADSLRLDTSLPAGSLLNGDGELNYQTNNIFFGMRLKF